MSQAGSDLRFVLRQLAAKPFFTAVAVLSLGFGIGANTAIFSVVQSTLLRPLPYDQPGRLELLTDQQPAFEDASLAPGEYLEYRRQSKSFSDIAAVAWQNFTLTGTAVPLSLKGRAVSANFFRVLGAHAERGRLLSPWLDKPTADVRAAVVSDSFWRGTFGGDPNIVGRKITLNDKPFQIVGVLAPKEEYPADMQVWVAPRTVVPEYMELGAPSPAIADNNGMHWMLGLGRLKPGVSPDAAQAELKAIAQRIHREHHTTELHWAKAVPLQGSLVQRVRPAMLVLSIAVFALLLIACANLAGLLLARSSGRTRELSIRVAMGASRSRILTLLLMETLCVAALGGIVSLFFAGGSLALLRHYSPYDLPAALAPRLDAPVLLFCLAVSLFSALVTGIVAALQASRVDVQEGLKESAKGSASGRTLALRRVLVTGQIALSVMLLIGALLLLRSFTQIINTDPGFAAARIITAEVSLPPKRYTDDVRITEFWDRLRQGVAALPGVDAAAISMFVPVEGVGMGGDFAVEGVNDREPPYGDILVVSPGLVSTLHIPLLAGREFVESDRNKAKPVVLVNKALADRYFPNRSAVGKHLRRGDQGPWLTIVGVVANAKWDGLDAKKTSLITYLPYTEFGSTLNSALVIRSIAGGQVTATQLRQVVHSIDPDVPLSDFQSLDERVDKSLGQRSFLLGLLTTFTVLAVALAAVGLYAILAYTVGQRKREFGIRFAVGASRPDVVSMVLRDSFGMAIIGIIAGVVGAIWSTSLLESLLFGISAGDQFTYLAAVAIMAAIALAASTIPAWRAAATDPAIALRYE